MGRELTPLADEFYSPLNHVLIKGAEEGGKWIVYLQASNELRDQEGETVEMDALKKAADYFLSHGVLSWDHKHKATHDPGFIIGEPLAVKFTPSGETLVKGFLYKKNKIAKNLWDNIQSGAMRLGASIGGGILQKAKETIKRVIWDETALTHKPINDGTLGMVQVVPFAQFAKALTAGAGVNATLYTGGRSLTPENMQGSTVDVLPGVDQKELRSMFGDLLKAIRERRVNSYNDMLNFVFDRGFYGQQAIQLVNYIAQTVPGVVGTKR